MLIEGDFGLQNICKKIYFHGHPSQIDSTYYSWRKSHESIDAFSIRLCAPLPGTTSNVKLTEILETYCLVKCITEIYVSVYCPSIHSCYIRIFKFYWTQISIFCFSFNAHSLLIFSTFQNLSIWMKKSLVIAQNT